MAAAQHSHSVIIPCFNRPDEIQLTILSLQRAALSARKQIELLVCYPKGTPPPVEGQRLGLDVRLVEHGHDHGLTLAPEEPEPYWKAKALNAGIEAATGEILTFFDTGTLVACHFFRSSSFSLYLRRQNIPQFFKRCYRVQYVTHRVAVTRFAGLRKAFRYGDLSEDIAFEAYGSPDADLRNMVRPPRDPTLIFGNSQFSIRRNILAKCRFDERYIGRGYEDIDMNRRLGKMVGYRARIVTDARVFHIKHPMTAGYSADRWNDRNKRRYYSEPRHWYVCHDAHQACAMHDQLHAKATKDLSISVTWPPNDAWELSAVISELDTVYRVAEDGTITTISEPTG